MNFFYCACIELIILALSFVALASTSPAVSGARDQHQPATSGQLAVNVGVVMGDKDGLPEKMTWTSLRTALLEFYTAHPNYTTRLLLHHRFSPSHDILSSASAVLDLIKNVQVEAIIGPETSMEAQFEMSLAEKAQVPMLSYSATSPLLPLAGNSYFIQSTQLDSAQVSAISSIVQAFQWRQVVLIYVGNEFGGGIVSALADALQSISTHISYKSVISSSPTDDQIEEELYKIKSMDTRVFIVHMDTKIESRLFSHAKKLRMMERDYAWIVTTGIANLMSSLKRSEIRTMQGVIGVRNYYPDTPEVEDFVARLKKRIVVENRDVSDPQINVFQLWASDAVTALARAAEKVNSSNFRFEKPIASSDVSITDLSTLGVSKAGPELIRALHNTKFQGLSGDFELVDGRLKPSILEIINVIGNGEKTVGFWSPQLGLTRELTSTESVSRGEQFGAIIWPGDSKDPPKGWVVSPNGKKLKVLVPYKNGFEEFVKVTPLQITGYCIDIFDAVMKSLPYPVDYEYHVYRKPDNDTSYSYNELIDEIYYQRYDAVVGDVTIIANRSLYADFSLPFTESGVSMVVPVKDNNKKKAWVFLMPLSWDLWVTTLCFFVFIAFVIWVLEHRINPQFRGPLFYQAGTSLYYSFSTMVFAHSQHVFSNTARFVVIIWVFLVLILTQCYTASLTSMLTIQQLQPTVTDVKELIKTGKLVGYQEGSFIKDLLIRIGFNESNLRTYSSPQELDELLTKGSKGGVEAAFDEFPYLNVFLASYCSKYVMVPPTYKTDGFGFVFPLGSPIVGDISRQILRVTEGDGMVAIERKWFGYNASCTGSLSNSLSSSGGIGLDGFGGLFLVAGCTATFAVLVSLFRFIYEYRNVWSRSDPSVTVWGRVKELATIFDQRKLESHTFKIGEPRDTSQDGSSSPLSFSNYRESTSSHGYSNPSTSASSSPLADSFPRKEELAVEMYP